MRWSICSLLLWISGGLMAETTNQLVKPTPRPISGAALEFFMNENFGAGIAPRPFSELGARQTAPSRSLVAKEMELQELGVAMDALRRENAALQGTNRETQRDLNLATNRVAQLEARLAEKRRGLAADDSEARSPEEWRAFLLSALKALGDAEREDRLLLERLRLLRDASRDALQSAEKVSGIKRSQLEAELRQAEKFLSQEKAKPVFLMDDEGGLLKGVRVIGVNLDLGVAALGGGRRQGIRVGMPFVVNRGKTLLAVLNIAEVRETASLALIEQMEPSQPIREGDAAELRKN